jgi:hypothetical protein
MFGFSARLKMDVGVIARSSRRLQGVIFLVGGQLLKAIVDLLCDQVALLDPAFQAGIRAHARESAVTFENLDFVTILYSPNFAIHRGYPIAKDRLRDGHIFKFCGFPMSATTGK